MVALSISQAAEAAGKASQVLSALFTEQRADGITTAFLNDSRDPAGGGKFDGGDACLFHGGSSHSAKSALGYVATGTGRRQSEALIVFRGSDTRNRIKDDVMLIDAAAAFGTSPKGWAVHGGFGATFASCRAELDQIVNALPRQVRKLHIVGHSMGGALATLAAEHFTDTRFTPHLHTFGAPRVGGVPHTQYLKGKMGDRINRYYYAGDVVPWLPMWPYVHLPGKRLVAAGGLGGHGSYFESKNLVLAYGGSYQRRRGQTIADVEALIEAGNSVGGGAGMQSSAWRYLTIAMHKLMYLAGMAIGATVFSIATAIDQVAATIAHFARSNSNARPLVVKWIVGAFKVLRRTVFHPGDSFSELVVNLKYVLGLMLNGARNMLQQQMANAQRIIGQHQPARRNGRVIVHFD